MTNLRQVTLGILAVLVSITIIFGSLMTGFVETGLHMALPPSDTPNSSIAPSPSPLPGTPTAIPFTGTPLPTETATVTPTPYCIPPKGWIGIIVQPGDTLESLAETYHTSVKKLKTANCLITNDLIPGTILYVPPVEATPTATEYQCGPPYGWVTYTVRSGDTLYSIAQTFGTTVAALQQANCMGSSTNIRAGQQLYVPYYATSTPGTSPTQVPTYIPTVVNTPIYPSTPTIFPTLPGTPFPTLEPAPTLIAPIPY